MFLYLPIREDFFWKVTYTCTPIIPQRNGAYPRICCHFSYISLDLVVHILCSSVTIFLLNLQRNGACLRICCHFSYISLNWVVHALCSSVTINLYIRVHLPYHRGMAHVCGCAASGSYFWRHGRYFVCLILWWRHVSLVLLCMYVCMYVCMYACMHVCLNVCIYVCGLTFEEICAT